jgi:tellurite resistance protein
MSKLEDLFFLKKESELLAKYQEMQKMKETMENLRDVSGIHDEQVLKKFIDLNIRPETLASLALVPCVLVAWADGQVDYKETTSIMKTAAKIGWGKTSIDYILLNHWLKNKPSPLLQDAWLHFVENLCKKMTSEEILRFKEEIIAHAKVIAQSSGGFWSFGKISKAEKEVLNNLAHAFTICRNQL